jgi:hypothetical protein
MAYLTGKVIFFLRTKTCSPKKMIVTVFSRVCYDGVTLKGDSIYFSSVSATTLNDVNSNRGMSDENLVSKAYQVVPVTQMMLVAANELTVKTQSVSATSALQH